MFKEHLKKLLSADFQQAQNQRQEVINKKKSSEVVQTHIDCTT